MEPLLDLELSPFHSQHDTADQQLELLRLSTRRLSTEMSIYVPKSKHEA